MSAADLSRRVQEGWHGARRVRHAARAPRYLLLAVLGVFLVLGIRATFFPAAATSSLASAPRAADAPSRDFAVQFARAYLTYDAAHPGRRAHALAPFLAGDQLPADSGFALAHGSQSVRWADVASDQPALQGGRAITVAAGLSDQSLPLYLAVTVRHSPGRPLELLGYPAIVGAPAIVAAEPQPSQPVEDAGLEEVVERVLRNYLAGDALDLRADLSADAQVTLPTRRLNLTEIEQLTWLGPPESGALLATAVAADSLGNTYTLAYELGITDRDRPYVDYIELVPTAG